MRKKTIDEVRKILSSYECSLLSKEYINNRQKLDIECKCGNFFNKSLESMNRYKKYMCNTCADKESRVNRRIKYEDIKKSIEETGYTLMTAKSDYTKAEEKIKVKCNKGHIYDVGYYEFSKRGQRCLYCQREIRSKKQTISYEDICKYVESIDYKLITKKSDYIDTKHYVFVECDKNHIYKTKINSLKNGKRCKTCATIKNAERQRIPYEKQKEFVKSFRYELISQKEDYTNVHDKYIFKCDKGHIYKASFSDFQQGCRCPICRISKGEAKVESILKKYGIEYILQYKFDDCKFYNKLPFDFYIPSMNACIEYDGKQHFQYVHRWGGYDEFINRLIRDSIKNIYCRENKIKLIRIPYYEFKNIEEILLNKLNIKIG